MRLAAVSNMSKESYTSKNRFDAATTRCCSTRLRLLMPRCLPLLAACLLSGRAFWRPDKCKHGEYLGGSKPLSSPDRKGGADKTPPHCRRLDPDDASG